MAYIDTLHDRDKDGELGLAPGNYLQFLEEETKATPAPAPAAAAAPTSPRGGGKGAAAAAVAEADEEPSPVVAKKEWTKAAVPVAHVEVEPEVEPEADAQGEEEESEPIGWATALYDFAGDGDDELPVKTGDRVEGERERVVGVSCVCVLGLKSTRCYSAVYAEIEGWYSASGKDGKYGLCPKNFFSELKPL